MKRLAALLALVIAGCSALPEDGPRSEKLSGSLLFPETTALAPRSIAHVKLVPLDATGIAKPIAEVEVPARTGNSIPFTMRVPHSKLSGGGEYLVFAQVIDHGVVRWSNLTSPHRISFAVEPTSLQIPLRRESPAP